MLLTKIHFYFFLISYDNTDQEKKSYFIHYAYFKILIQEGNIKNKIFIV